VWPRRRSSLILKAYRHRRQRLGHRPDGGRPDESARGDELGPVRQPDRLRIRHRQDRLV